MGCCKHNSVPSGFLLPEQEQGIAQIEKAHPFARLEADTLFEALCVKGVSGEMKESDFFGACKRLQIPADEFYRIDSQFTPYFYELKKKNGLIDLQILFLSAVLVCKSQWELKLKMILIAFELNGQEIPLSNIVTLLELMVYVSTSVLPRITIMNLSQRAIDFYTNRLINVKSFLISTVLSYFGNNHSVSEVGLFKVFSQNPELQKVFWSNGVRMMLIEEDTRLVNAEGECARSASFEQVIIRNDNLPKLNYLKIGELPSESESTKKSSFEFPGVATCKF